MVINDPPGLERQDWRSLMRQSMALHPLLTLLGFAMIAALLGTTLGVIFDHRVITGAPAWLKPAKFSISICIYSFTLLWMLTFIQGHKRLIRLISNVTAIGFFIEMVIVFLQVIRGTTSHFNNSTPFNATLYNAMGTIITFVWIMGLITAVLLLMQRMPNPAFAWSLRLGILLSLLGMAIGFLMTIPTPVQIATHSSILGAHSVGVVDGGPGLPLVGWSTVGGDLRIGHFIGIHALQILPFFGWLITILPLGGLGRGHRIALVWVAALSYLALVMLVTWQALRGQSIVAPDALTLRVLAVLIAVALLSVLAIITHARLAFMSSLGRAV